MSYEVPFVEKENVTIISLGDSLKAATVRAILESYNYRVAVQWVGSRKELVAILSGDIFTDNTLILSCHGTKEGIVIPDEPALTAEELSNTAKLPGKTIINLGCLTGSPVFVNAFKTAGVQHYIAPIDYPEGKAAINFTANLFLLISSKVELGEAVARAADFDAETQQFKLLH